jgi:hypothetical protein
LRPFRIKNLRQFVHGFSLQSSSRTREQITLFAVPQALNCSASKDRPIDTTPCLANHLPGPHPAQHWTAICGPRPRRQWRNRSPCHSAGRRARVARPSTAISHPFLASGRLSFSDHFALVLRACSTRRRIASARDGSSSCFWRSTCRSKLTPTHPSPAPSPGASGS